jgi:general secretion pathway protein D
VLLLIFRLFWAALLAPVVLFCWVCERSLVSPSWRLLWLALLALGLGLGAGPGHASTHAASPGVTLNFQNGDIDGVARVMAAIMGRPISVDPRVAGKVTLYTDTPVSQAQAYALFVSALRGLGYVVVESGGLLKIVPELEGKLQAGTVVTEPGSPHNRDQIATQVFTLTHENASNLVAVLRPLISPNNTINVNPGNNTLIITDYTSNLARLRTLISALDTPSATDVEVIPLQYALASELAVTVQRLSDGAVAGAGSGAGGGTGSSAPSSTSGASSATTILADTHGNALLVKAANQARLAAVRSLVARLDRPGASGAAGSNIHVIYLKHAEATRLATVLRSSFAAEGARMANNGAASGGASGGGAPTSTSAAGVPASTSGSSSKASTQAASPTTATAQPVTGGFIQADPATNALIVTAPEPVYRELRAVVDMLDTRRSQIYVESLVVEVDASKTYDVGVQWKQIFNISSSTELTLGTVASAIESLAGTNILSTANIVTLDNEEAKIVVGQNVPFVTGSYTSSSSSSTNPFQTIERKDVGITLRIRPQIGADGRIRMSIFQESSSVSTTTAAGTSNAGPTTNTRSIESNVVVKDGRIIVLGGLIEDSYTTEAALVPGMWEVPILGRLFRSLTSTRKKNNLVVFLRPRVMTDDDATDLLALDRYAYIRARQQALPLDPLKVLQHDEASDVTEATPLLPALGGAGRTSPKL